MSWRLPYYVPIQNSCHYSDVIMSAMVSPITSLMIVYSSVYSGADQRKHQSSVSLVFVRGIHWWPVNYTKPVTRKMFPFDDVIMEAKRSAACSLTSFTIYLQVIMNTGLADSITSNSKQIIDNRWLWKLHELRVIVYSNFRTVSRSNGSLLSNPMNLGV